MDSAYNTESINNSNNIFNIDTDMVLFQKLISDKWSKNNTYLRLVKELMEEEVIDGNEPFEFTDGPPFVSSNVLHCGHALISWCKSTMCFYQMLHGRIFKNKIGYDCHGLPIEMVVSKNLKLNGPNEIIKFGIGKYNEICKKYIYQFSNDWKPVFEGFGRWINYDDQYKTIDKPYMESCNWAFKQLFDKNLIYIGYKVMPFSCECGTTLSAMEAADNYQDIITRSLYVLFRILDDKYPNTYFIAWTTTAWTLPSNIALCLNPKGLYVKIFDGTNNYIVANGSQHHLFKNIIETTNIGNGQSLAGIRYEPLFDFFPNLIQNHYYTIVDDYVVINDLNIGSGTGIVHIAPCYGEDDFRICTQQNVVTQDEINDLCQVNDDGKYISGKFKGQSVIEKETETAIIIELKTMNKWFKTQEYSHKYPMCPRTDKKLIYKVIRGIFMKVSVLKERMLEINETINWIPKEIGCNRFAKGIETAPDWCLSRSRFWGLPIMLWASEDYKEIICIETIDELKKLAKLSDTFELNDIHREFLDDITIISDKTNNILRRVPFVFDCWFESGCVPFAQYNYPYNSNVTEIKPADFICEGVDQTRGWFYSLTVLSTALFNQPAFKNVICTELVCNKIDGKKMSKRSGNFIDPLETIKIYGSDFMRLYFLSSPALRGSKLMFDEKDVKNVKKQIIPYINAVKYLSEYLCLFIKKDNVFDTSYYKKTIDIYDLWIISKLGTLLNNVESNMNSYHIDTATIYIINFIENLTNWYIKINRNRLNGSLGLEQQHLSLSTLYYVIYSYCVISSPFMPFLSEYIFEYLCTFINNDINNDIQKHYSVFKCRYPIFKMNINNDVEKQMNDVQNVISLVRVLRTNIADISDQKYKKDKTNLNMFRLSKFDSLRVPILKLIIGHSDLQFIENIKNMVDLIKDEVNCINIEIFDSSNNIDYDVIPNEKILGKKYGKNAKYVKEEVLNLSFDQKESFYKNKVYQLNYLNILIDFEDFIIKLIPKKLEDPNVICTYNNELLIGIDTQNNESVMIAHNIRLFVCQIQKIRKEIGVHPWDPIEIIYNSCVYINDLINNNIDIIFNNLKLDKKTGSNILNKKLDVFDFTIDINEYKINITIVKL